jgi:hypothetical protein
MIKLEVLALPATFFLINNAICEFSFVSFLSMPLRDHILGKFRGEIASFLAVKPSPSLVIASLLVSICCGFDIKKNV